MTIPSPLPPHRHKRGLRDRESLGTGIFILSAIVPGAIGAIAGILTGIRSGATGWSIALWALGGALVIGCASAFAVAGISRLGGSALKQIIQPSGSGSPYENRFSHEESMVARGDVDGALIRYEEHIHANATAVTPRLRAAELYARDARNLGRAVELYREVQRTANVSAADDVYATNQLIDIYLGPMASKDNAMSELRRLIANYPTSSVAAHARTALVDLKRQLRSDEAD